MKQIFLKIKCIYFYTLFILIFNSCSKQTETNNIQINSENFISTNYSKIRHRLSNVSKKSNASAKDFYFEQDFLAKLERSIQKSTTYKIDMNALNEIRNYSDSWTNEQKYQTIINLIKNIPVPYYLDSDSDYKIMYDKLIEYSKRLYKKTSKRVPKNIHFIWLGGKLGNIQKDYINLWSKLNGNEYKIYIWYDSNNINNYNLNKKLSNYLNIFLSNKKKSENFLEIYSEEMIKIQNNLNNYIIRQNKENPKQDNNEIRLNFIKHFFKTNNHTNFSEISDIIPDNNNFLASVESLLKENENIIVKDIQKESNSWILKENYNQELNLRSNFAAASDNARLEILKEYGGIYIDVDVLPSISKLNELTTIELKGVKSIVKSHFKLISYAYYETIFNTNPNILPSRTISNENNNDLNLLLNSISTEDAKILKEKINEHYNYFKTENNIEYIFNKVGNIYIRPLELKTSLRNNNFIISHENDNNNNIINLIIDQIKNNYNEVNKYEKNNPNFYYSNTTDFNDFIDDKDKEFNKLFERSVSKYRYDSLIPDSSVTVLVSGPLAYDTIFKKNNFKHENLSFLTQYSDSNEIYNRHTEEDKKSSWVKGNIESLIYENVILKLSNNTNSTKAINYYSNHFKENGENFSIISLLENKKINLSNGKKINLFIIGNSGKNNNEITIDKLSFKEIGDYINKIFPEKTEFEFINLISCNPTNNSNDTNDIERFGKSILNHLNENKNSANLIILRNSFIKIDKNGKEVFPNKFGIFSNSSEENKIFLIRRSSDDFISLKSNISSKIDNTGIFNKLINYTQIIKNITTKKTSHLAEITEILDNYKFVLRKQNEESKKTVIKNITNKNFYKISENELLLQKVILNSKLSETDLYDFYNNISLINREDIDEEIEYNNNQYFLNLIEYLENKYQVKENKFLAQIKDLINKNKSELQLRLKLILDIKLKNLENEFSKISLSENEKPILHTFNKDKKTISIYNQKNKKVYIKEINFISEEGIRNINDGIKLIDNSSLEYMKHKNSFGSFMEISGPSVSLSHAYLLKNIIEFFSKKNNESQSSNKSTLDEIVKIHMYTNMSQLSNDVLESSVKVSKVIKLISNNEFKNLNSFQTFSKFSATLGSVLNVANVIFDASEYHYAKTEAEKSKFGTQLALDSTSLTLMSAGLILGESAGGIFLSGIGEIFGGLAVGISSYAEIVGDKIDQTLKLARYFKDYENDHYKLIEKNNYFFNSEEKILTFAHKDFTQEENNLSRTQLNVVVEEMDFKTSGSYKIIFGDHITYPISRHENGKYFYHVFAPNPALIKDSSEKVKFREALNIPTSYTKELDKTNKIILPNQVKNLIEYYFMNVPFNVTRNDAEFSAVDKLQNNSKFIFRYTFMHGFGDQAVGLLKFIPQKTDIRLKLNHHSQHLQFITPEIPDSAKNKIFYHVEIEDSIKNKYFHFFINNMANYIFTCNKSDNIHIHIDSKLDKAEILNTNELKIFTNKYLKIYDNIKFIHFPEKIFIHDSTGVTYLVYNKSIINEKKPIFINPIIDYNSFHSKDEIQSIINNYSTNIEATFLANNQKIKIINYPSNANNGFETVFYDLNNEEIIYSGFDNKNLVYLTKINSNHYFTNSLKNKLYINSKELFKDIDKIVSISDNSLNINIRFDFNIKANESGFVTINTGKDIRINNKLNIEKNIEAQFLELFPLVQITFNEKSLGFYNPKSKIYFLENDANAKLISYSNISNSSKTFYISGEKLNSFHKNSKGEFIFEELEISNPQYLYEMNEYAYFLSNYFVYQVKNNEFNIVGIKSDYLKNYLGKSMEIVFNDFENSNNNLAIIFNEKVFFELNLKENKIFQSDSNKKYIGINKNNNNIHYYYDKKNNQLFTIDKDYFDPKNHIIKIADNNIFIEYNKQKTWELVNGDLFASIKSDNFLNYFHNFNEFFEDKLEDKTCSSFQNTSENIYNQVCQIVKNINNDPFQIINGYSDKNNSTILLTKNQASFRLYDNSNFQISFKNTAYEYWGVGNWLSNELPYTGAMKYLAFGGLLNNLNSIYADIRFIDVNGNILKAISENGYLKKYTIENTLSSQYIKNVYAAFILNDLYHDFLVFLRRDGLYDILSPINYKVVKTDFIKNIFKDIPDSSLIYIDQAIKMKDKIILLQREKNSEKYEAFYIIESKNLLLKNSKFIYEKIDIN
ncbi:TcdA/TcdB catalytic glycosyltransferase domain-containing protein [Pigmentibacter ruber]|uniref:TcdA/TcdB catalytic glycosyltransferase domain-containing protein n=1 Tax=Pigmentibacter ruber TaxID=2683196 RepID=UPI00131BAE1A|nr:TcdA/TcdB catalytic glycosyltransferase domain-containing protein [Pigmentibacter ruber]